jgi:hypothetical protein
MQENQWLADAKANFMWEFAQIAAFARDPSIFEAYDYHGDGIGSYEPEAPLRTDRGWVWRWEWV